MVNLDTGTQIQGEHGKTKPEIKVMLPQAKEIEDCQQTTRSQGRGMEKTFPHSPEKKQA